MFYTEKGSVHLPHEESSDTLGVDLSRLRPRGCPRAIKFIAQHESEGLLLKHRTRRNSLAPCVYSSWRVLRIPAAGTTTICLTSKSKRRSNFKGAPIIRAAPWNVGGVILSDYTPCPNTTASVTAVS